MSALFTALLESESKESLAKMVCELRSTLAMIEDETKAEGVRSLSAIAAIDLLEEIGTIARTALSQLRQEG